VRTADDHLALIDLGPWRRVDELGPGDTITARGHLSKVGEKRLLIAATLQRADQTLRIERPGRRFEGQIADTRVVQLRGRRHLLARVETEGGKKMLVDLGPQGANKLSPQQGQRVVVEGVPTKVRDRVMLMARRVTLGDSDRATIRRRAAGENR
jgi:hypothetical protein